MRPAEARHAEGAMANSRAAETRDAEGASPDARPAETRHAEGATAPEASAARGKAAAVAAKAATVTAEAPPCPPPPRASASSVKSGTTRSNVATVQTPAIDPWRLARDAGVAAAAPRPRYQGRAICCAAACSADAIGRTLGYFHEGRACNPDMGAFLLSRAAPTL